MALGAELEQAVDAESWKHVAEYLALLKRLRELALPPRRVYPLYLKVKGVVKAERELYTAASHVSWRKPCGTI